MKTLISSAPSYLLRIYFENMNCLTKEGIKSFELIFFDRYIDTGVNDTFFFNIYPNRASSEIKEKFKNIEVLHKFIKTISKNLSKDYVTLSIWSSILEDADVVYLWWNKIWKDIRFFDCLIQNTKKAF